MKIVAVIAATFCLAAVAASAAHAMNGGGANGVAKKSASVTNVIWNGLQVSLWNVPGNGIYAYKIIGPAAFASGWRFCETEHANSVDECLGAAHQAAR
jgi:hypothetical protein